MSREEILRGLAEATAAGDAEKCISYAREALHAGIDAYEAIMEGCAAGMKAVSEKYDSGDIFVPELLLSAEAMYAAMDVLKPELNPGKVASTGTVAIGVVEGDVHDIGKNLVKIMLDATGYRIVDLGRDVPVREMALKAQEANADVLAISTLMTTTMPKMKKVVDELAALGIRERVKVLIGGAPTSMEFAKSIGADSWGKDATSAVNETGRLIAASKR